MIENYWCNLKLSIMVRKYLKTDQKDLNFIKKKLYVYFSYNWKQQREQISQFQYDLTFMQMVPNRWVKFLFKNVQKWTSHEVDEYYIWELLQWLVRSWLFNQLLWYGLKLV